MSSHYIITSWEATTLDVKHRCDLLWGHNVTTFYKHNGDCRACKRTRKNEVICCSSAQVQKSDAVTQLSLGYVSNSLRNTAQISKQKKTFGHFNLYFLILTNTYAAT